MFVVYLFVFFISAHCAPQFYSHLDTLSGESSDELLQVSRVAESGARFRRCTDQLVHIPYKIEDKFSEAFHKLIHENLDYYQNKTCLRFTEVESFNLTDPLFEDGSGILYFTSCTKDRPFILDYLNSTEGGNLTIIDIPLDEETLMKYSNKIGRISQQLYYALGFTPENLRPDRDEYVTVLWDNIEPGNESMFRKLRLDKFQILFPYDHSSISHYFATDFGENGKVTLISKDLHSFFRYDNMLSPLDVVKINDLYCNKSKHTPSSESPTTTDDWTRVPYEPYFEKP